MPKVRRDTVPVQGVEMDPVTARIKRLMQARGWGQRETGLYLGVSQNTVSAWLAGTRRPGHTVERLIDVLGMVEALMPALHESMIGGINARDNHRTS